MPRRRALTSDQLDTLMALPTTEAEIIQHYTLSTDDISVICRRRRSWNRLGFAVQLCGLRYPGRLLRPGELVPEPIVQYVSQQLDILPEDLAEYGVSAPKWLGLVRGPIEAEFRRIQGEIGEQAAFEYLSAEAGGLHVTPYGYCLSSLTVDPCPKNLECFNDCRHLARTGLESETIALRTLRDQLTSVIKRLESGALATRGAQNQLIHAQRRLNGVEKALATPAGAPTTPSGADRLRRFNVTHSTKGRNNG